MHVDLRHTATVCRATDGKQLGEGIWTYLVDEVAGIGDPDFSGIVANANLEKHIEGCKEWRAEIRAEMRDLKAEINKINNRLFSAAVTMILLLTTILGTLLTLYVLPRGGLH